MPDFNIFCNNCGNNGHLFYQCKKPITSIGILLCSLAVTFITNGIKDLVDNWNIK